MGIESQLASALRSNYEYYRENLSTLSMKAVRRLLEKELEMGEKSLDEHKDLVSKLVDQVVLSNVWEEENKGGAADAKENQPVGTVKANKPKPEKLEKKAPAKAVKAKADAPSKKASRKSGKKSKSDADMSDVDEEEEEEERPRKGKATKKRDDSEDDSEAASEDEDAQAAKRRKPTVSKPLAQQYGKQVLQLKDICAQATIKIPPNVYSKHRNDENGLIRALEELLGKQGLNARASYGEIQEVKKRLAKERDLDGIDMSNIIQTEGRRPRRAAAAPVSYKTVFQADSDEEDEEEDDQESNSSSEAGSDVVGSDCDEDLPSAKAKKSSSKKEKGKKLVEVEEHESESEDESSMEDVSEEDDEEEKPRSKKRKAVIEDEEGDSD